MSGFQWKLRLVHEGHAGVVMERPGRRIRFDPVALPEPDDIVVLTGADPFAPERAIGFHTVVRGHGKGEVDTEIDGVRFQGITYDAAPRDGSIVRVSSALRQPSEAARRWLARRRPDVPTIWQLTFRNGDRLVHLGGAFHRDTDVGWAADVVTRNPLADRGRSLRACSCARVTHRCDGCGARDGRGFRGRPPTAGRPTHRARDSPRRPTGNCRFAGDGLRAWQQYSIRVK